MGDPIITKKKKKVQKAKKESRKFSKKIMENADRKGPLTPTTLSESSRISNKK